MTLFNELFSQTLPLYLLIVVGFLAGRYLSVNREATARLLIYVVSPAVIFFGTLQAPLSGATLSLPLLLFAICSSVALSTHFLTHRIYKSGTERNILAFAVGSGNTGYFGIPVALFLYGESAIPIQIIAIQGFLIFENTLGFYLTARGNFSARESIRKVVRLPSLYAFLVGLLCQLLGITIEGPLSHLYPSFRGAYTVLGMMMLGLGFAQLKRPTIDLRFTSIAFLAKFGAWPALMAGVILLNQHFLHFYDAETVKILWLLAIVPLPINSVALAAELRAHPEKMSVTVLLSTLFALLYMPLMLGWMAL